MKNFHHPLYRELVIVAVALVILLAIPSLTSSRLITDSLIRLAALSMFATSLNILIGYGGMVSFGHAMFYAGGAYVFGLLMQKAGTSIPVALFGAVVFCALLGLIIGAICVRLGEIYFAFLTLAFSMLGYSVILSWVSLTGGDQGLIGGVPRPPFLGMDLSNDRNLYLFVCVLAVVCLLLMRLLLQSPFGYTLRMVRDNSDRARFLGVNVWRTRLYAFVLSAVFAGVAGSIMALFVSGAYPQFAYWLTSGTGIVMIMLGGLHVFIGPLVGSVLLMNLNDVVARFTDLHGLVLGIVLLIFALGFKQGIADFAIRLFRRIQKNRERK